MCPELVEGRAMTSGWVAAVDLGATSGRVMLGRVGPDELSVEAVHRFPNDPVRLPDGLHWNVLDLYRNLLIGLRKAVRAQPGLAGVGIASWAVDYGLVSGNRLINNPYHYRDERTARGVELVHKIADHATLYGMNGLQFQPFNSIYQLAVDQETGIIDDSARMLMLPDLLGFWLTGEEVAERTNASTTGLLDIATGAWNATLIDKMGFPRSLFPPLVDPGSRIGSLRDEVAAEIAAPSALDVIAVGSHDTASAVVGVPMTEPGAAYISSGTWSLVGVELDRPVLTEDSREANFTNEGGVDGKIRYLRNVMGMWLLTRVHPKLGAGRAIRRVDEAARRGGRCQYPSADLRRESSQPAAAWRHAQADCRTVCRSHRSSSRLASGVCPQHPGEPRRGVRERNR